MSRFGLLVVLLSSAALANPAAIHHSGRVLDDLGAPIEGSVDLTFTVHVDASTSASLWTESETVIAQDGYYSVILGDDTPFPSDLWTGSVRWLQLAVDSEPVSPRTPIHAVPTAFHAASADTATTADSATTAGHASTADSATTAGHATTAGSATTAGHASTADSATIADSATTADSAALATRATSAGFADHSETSDWATMATDAVSADHATTADSATNATGAITPTSIDVSGAVYAQQGVRLGTASGTCPSTISQGTLQYAGGALQVCTASGWLTVGAQLECPAGWWSVNQGKLCVQNTLQPAASAHDAIGACSALSARVCTHNDAQQACGAGFNPHAGATYGWYGDHGYAVDIDLTTTGNQAGNTDDEYLTWNRDYCTLNNDGPAYHANQGPPSGGLLPYRCCK